MLHRLVYRSEAARLGGAIQFEELAATIIVQARQRNAESGVTGALMHADGAFVQMLEGPLDAIEATFERVCGDFRHRQMQLIDFGSIEKRVFEGQPMASIRPLDGLLQLGATLSPFERTKVDPAGADALIQLMRSAAGSPERAQASLRD